MLWHMQFVPKTVLTKKGHSRVREHQLAALNGLDVHAWTKAHLFHKPCLSKAMSHEDGAPLERRCVYSHSSRPRVHF